MKKFTLSALLFAAIFSLSLLVNQITAQTYTKTFTTNDYTSTSSDGTSSTWTVPTGVTSITVIAIGGGGGGGALHSAFSGAGTTGSAGGGGGAYVKATNYPVNAGDELTIHVGSKGSGHHSQGVTHPGWGGDSWVKIGSTTIVLAKGASDVPDQNFSVPGTGGQADACIAPSGSEIYSGGNGGYGSTGTWCGAGGGGAAGGGNGGNGADGDLFDIHRGTGGTTTLLYAGNGGAGSYSSTLKDNTGDDGNNYGGGGGGGATDIGWSDANGGDGAPGYVVITYTIACDATPGAIAAETWVCNATDTAVVISSTTAATSTVEGDYLWEKSTDGSTWTAISGANAAQYSATETGYYRRGYAVEGCSTVYTSSVYVTRPSNINPGTLADNSGATSMTVCAGTDVSVNLVATTTYTDITWQTSTDKETWTDVTTVSPLAITGISQTTYVRFVVNYTTSCGVPSNNIYTITVNELPVVNSLAAPTDLCPGQASYDIIASTTSAATITTYTWTGASGSSSTGTITPTLPNCGTTYNYSLVVTDANGCSSTEKTGSFTTTTPALTIGTIADVTAATDGSCNFAIPDTNTLTAAVNAALTSTCGNTVTLSDFNPAVGAAITVNGSVAAVATDMCGNTQNVTIPVVIPAAPTVTVTADDELVCPGETTTLTATATGEELTYAWAPTALGTEATATTIAVTEQSAVSTPSTYTVTVTDKYGCVQSGSVVVTTTPKAYIANKEYTVCPSNVELAPVATDIIPAGTAYATSYTWTITSNTGVTGAADGNGATFTTGNLTNETLETQTVVYNVTPTTVTTVGTSTNSCDGAAFTVTVNVKPIITTAGAITDFDNKNDTIILWYGACDTLYYVDTPTYVNNTDVTVTLTNDKATVNEGTTLLGRIAPGEYTIVWTLTDECGYTLDYTKKYIVIYPNCGEADPNYPTEQPYTVTYDGYTYSTVRIGCECWLKENLRNEIDETNTDIEVAKAYLDDESNIDPYGRLYTWYSAMGVEEDNINDEPAWRKSMFGYYLRGICPDGWAIPTTAQFDDMMTYAHNNTREASSMNENFWLPGAAGVEPNNGFEAVGAGYYDHYADSYYNLLAETHFWTSDPASTVFKGECVTITHVCPELVKKEKMKGDAVSVRCVKIEPKWELQ
ncbi:MAG: fibrobacter succinogenes major paralogous domain-containing protein [Bacteroidales bacterium]|nr:fibrobacter succinogenes major paralogous domain-containing protein [Bacteroidales bacterium]